MVVFDETVKVMSRSEASQFTINKRFQLVDLILDELNSFKSELVQLDIYCHVKEFIYSRPGKKYGVISSLAVFIKDYFT